MIQEANTEDQLKDQPPAPPKAPSTFLLVDIGERHTTALLIQRVAGFCRLVSRAAVPSTHKPPHSNAGDGVLEAIQTLEEIGNQKILTSNNDLVLHTEQRGRGIDKFLISISMERIIRTVVVAPSVDDPAVESAVHLLQRFPSKLEKLFTGGNTHDLIEDVTWLANNRPDLVLIVGSDPRGRGYGKQIVRAATHVGIGVRQFSKASRPEVIYAASGHWDEDVKQALDLGAELKTAPNLRPDARHERVKPVRKLIEDVIRRDHLSQIPGLVEVMRWSGEVPYARNEGLAIFARFQAALVDGPILILDHDVNGLTMVYAKPNFTDLIIRSDLGLGKTLGQAAGELDLAELSQWVGTTSAAENSENLLHTHMINRSLFPNAIAQSKQELSLDLVMLQGLIRKGVQEASNAWGLDPEVPLSIKRLFVRGKILELTGDGESLILTLFNALQLQGECETFIDPHNAMALLGQLLEQEPTAAVDVIEADAFLSLGWLVGIPGRGRKGKNAVSVELKESNSAEPIVQEDIARGDLVSIGLPNGGNYEATLRYKRIGVSNMKTLEEIEGFKARIWVDGRGRPAVLPDNQISMWNHISPT